MSGEWESPELDISEAIAQLSPEGKKEWELAASRAMIAKLTEECRSLFDQVQTLEAELN